MPRKGEVVVGKQLKVTFLGSFNPSKPVAANGASEAPHAASTICTLCNILTRYEPEDIIVANIIVTTLAQQKVKSAWGSALPAHNGFGTQAVLHALQGVDGQHIFDV